MKLLKAGHRLVYRPVTGATWAASSWLLLPLGLGAWGIAGLVRDYTEPDPILLIPLGLSLALVVASLVGWFRLWQKTAGPGIKALIFDREDGRLILCDRPWQPHDATNNLDHLPSYGLGQFEEWFVRTLTHSWGAGQRGVGRTTTYAVSLRKTDGGYFDVLETGFEPRANAWLRQLQTEIPLGPTLRPPVAPPLPAGINVEQTPEGTLYTWKKAFRPGAYASGLLYLGVVAAGFFLVVGEATGEIADQIRLFLAVPLSLVLVGIVVTALMAWRRGQTKREFLLFRQGFLESGEVRAVVPQVGARHVRARFDFGQTIAVRYDRVLAKHDVTLTFYGLGTGVAFLVELAGLTESEAVVLERQFENEVRRYGGQSE